MKTVVQLVLMDETGDSYYRMRWPGRSVCDQDPEMCLINLDALAAERFKLGLEADLLVLFQSNDLDIIPLINKRRSLGKKTIVEYNDNFYSPPPSSPIYGPWCSPPLWQTYETIMKAGDHLIVTGEGLKSLLEEKVSCPVTILENHIYESVKSFDQVWDDTEDIRIGWAGSVGHMGDLIAVLPILENFCRQHKNVKLYLMGNETIPSLLTLDSSKFVFKPWGSMADYYDFLAEIHLGIAPLGDSDYNHCRSDIKAIEYASRGVFPIIQDLTPYKKLISSRVFQSFNSFSELEILLPALVKNKEELKSKTKAVFDFVKTERLAINRRERLDLYNSLINKDHPVKPSEIFSPGYKELHGTAKPNLDCSVKVQKAQALLKNKEIAACIDYIKENRDILAYEPSFPLILSEAIKLESPDDAFEILVDGSERFNLDIRYKLHLIKLKNTETERFALWLSLVDFIERQSIHYLNFYEKIILNVFFLDLKKFSTLLEIGLKLSEIYQDNFELLLLVGEAALKEKRYKQSYKLLKRAETIYNITAKLGETPEKNFNQYLLTLIEAADYSQRM